MRFEALSYGLPLVTTRCGAEGLENGNNTAFLLADTAADFCAAMLLLELEENRTKLGDRATNYLKSSLSAEHYFQVLFDTIYWKVCLETIHQAEVK
ncbi:MAG: hypothetical protein CMK09_04505 [Ponticaulis sp.]|nr:hypothetical protein [Ponticaulis sp.]